MNPLTQFKKIPILPLADPILQLYNANGTVLPSNDNWKINDRTHASQEAGVRARGLQAANDLEPIVYPSGSGKLCRDCLGKERHFRHRFG